MNLTAKLSALFLLSSSCLTDGSPAQSGIANNDVVWSYASSRSQAEAMLADYRHRSPAWKDALPLPSGYPKIIAVSATDAAASAGYRVVLGVCPERRPDVVDLMRFLRTVQPQAALIATTDASTPVSCPSFAESWELVATIDNRSGTLRLAAAVLGYDYQIPGLDVRSTSGSYGVLISLRPLDRPGEPSVAPLDWIAVSKDTCAVPTVTQTENGVVVTDDCVTRHCTQPERTETRTEWTAKDGRLVSRSRKTILHKVRCDD